MKSIAQILSAGHTFISGTDTYFVRAVQNGQIAIEQINEVTPDRSYSPVSASNTNLLWVSPLDPMLDEEKARILDLEDDHKFKRCDACATAGYTQYEDLCSGCQDNYTTINWLRNALG